MGRERLVGLWRGEAVISLLDDVYQGLCTSNMGKEVPIFISLVIVGRTLVYPLALRVYFGCEKQNCQIV